MTDFKIAITIVKFIDVSMQKIQNKAIRICLHLPRYVSIRILHENSCLPMIKERLFQLGVRMVTKMKAGNPLIRQLVEEKEAVNIQIVRSKGLRVNHRSHRSPLDIILPVQRPFLPSSQS